MQRAAISQKMHQTCSGGGINMVPETLSCLDKFSEWIRPEVSPERFMNSKFGILSSALTSLCESSSSDIL